MMFFPSPRRYRALCSWTNVVMTVILVIMLFNCCHAEPAQQCHANSDDSQCQASSSSAAASSNQCPSRSHIIQCAGAYLDLNQNGKLEREELQKAIDSLPWYARGVLNILGSVDKMMKKCDVDGDNAIGMEYDMQHNQETCLATCLKRRVFKSAFFPNCDLGLLSSS